MGFCVKVFVILFFIFLIKYSTNSDTSDGNDNKPISETIISPLTVSDSSSFYKKPSILIVSLIRNKAHTLPLFLTYLEDQNYPKDRISLWFATDHNLDNSREILDVWLKRTSNFYHSVHYQYDNVEKIRKGETNLTHWPEERFLELIRMKEEAFEHGRRSWADYIFFLDADAFLTSSDTLSTLVALNKTIVAPMLTSDGLYSNFWCGMSPDYYYKRTLDYKKIRNYEMTGEHVVPMVHTAVLVDLNAAPSDLLTFNKTKLNSYHDDKSYDGPIDDIIIFAISAKYSNIEMVVTNSQMYGIVLVPLDNDESMEKDIEQLTNAKISIIYYYDQVNIHPDLQKFVVYPEKSKLSLSEIYMINLKRRPERKIKMERTLKELGIDYLHFEAVDGKSLNDDYLLQKGITLMPEYSDPYHKRPMTTGEIGCFMSHYSIWQRMVELGQKEILILEDDIKFEPFFTERARQLIEEARAIGGWDLIYFGRKRLSEDESYIENNENLVKVSYTYWTLGYLISLEGAKKLLAAEPLKKLLPVDEFLPIMFNQHPNDSWSGRYETKNLIAWSVNPLLIFPTHYTGEEGYISDTEDSPKVDPSLKESLKFTENLINDGIKHDASEL